MRRPARLVICLLLLTGSLLPALLAAPVTPDNPDSAVADSVPVFEPPAVDVIHVIPYDGPITPLASEYITVRLDQAAAAAAVLVIIQLDTPGGLDVAMRTIIKSILASAVPVVVYVAPSGARAASAGAFITVAAHVAAMAPGTNIGSASPVRMGGAPLDSTMAKKVSNDASAYIAALARQRGRNEDLARRLVTEAANVPAEEAREAGLIDLVAPTMAALVDSLHGRPVMLAAGPDTLDVAGAVIEERSMGPRQRLLKRLADPNVAYILMLLGIYGLFFELSNPGALVPGILGGICLLLALYAFQALPVNYAGVGLILLGVVLLILEVKVPSFGGLTIGGVSSMVLGSLLLFDSSEPWARVSLRVLIPAVGVFAGFFVMCVWLAVRGHRRPVVSGREALIGETGRMVQATAPDGTGGKVVFHGEMWDAEADVALAPDAEVQVVAVRGRVVQVRALE